MKYSDYSKIQYATSADLSTFFKKEIIVQEKFDGSQISFYKDENGKMHVHSRSTELSLDRQELIAKKQNQFWVAIESILSLQDRIPTGYIFRGEYLEKVRHNVLTYERIPKNHVMVFDVYKTEVGYQSPYEVECLAASIGFESPMSESLKVDTEGDLNAFNAFLGMSSQLGGMREGIVLKRYSSGKLQSLKIVKQEFSEIAQPGKIQFKTPLKDRTPIKEIIELYKSAARWEKAYQHLKDAGQLQLASTDIAKLVSEVQADTLKECKQQIMEYLFERQWKEISKGLTEGLADWYLRKIVDSKDNQ